MQTLEDVYNYHCSMTSDINEHLPTLKKYASGCYHVTEFGVRWVCSTYGLMSGMPKKLTSYDINNVEPIKLEMLYRLAEDNCIDFKFIKADVLNTEIEQTDLLFIDTLHGYKQLKLELALHSHKVNSYIIFHDTVSYAYHDEGQPNPDTLNGNMRHLFDSLPPRQGLLAAIHEFLQANKDWQMEKHCTNNNGLMILKRNHA
jgi:hypothetical protein